MKRHLSKSKSRSKSASKSRRVESIDFDFDRDLDPDADLYTLTRHFHIDLNDFSPVSSSSHINLHKVSLLFKPASSRRLC